MTGKLRIALLYGFACAAGAVALSGTAAAQTEWKPTRNVEFVVPAGTGGGADQMARMIQGIVQKHGLMEQSIVVVNRSGGAGAEGFLDVKASDGDPHKIVITLSNLFTTPLATGVPFNWKDLTPVAMLALDEFILWVNASEPHQTAQDYVGAIKAAGDNSYKMGGTGSKQEDQIITAGLEQIIGKRLTYVPYGGGGEVAAQLVGNHVNSSVNNPIEAVSQWRAGALRPLCVFDDQRIAVTAPQAEGKAWSDVPTCKESGLDMKYLMLRGIFMPPGVEAEQVAYYVDLFDKIRATPEWAEFMATGAFNTTTMTGDAFTAWLAETEQTHKTLMEGAGFIAQ